MYWILKIQCQKSLWFKYCSFFGSLMLGVFNTDWFVRILFSDFNQTFHFYFNLGELVYENSIVSWSECTALFISPDNPTFKNFMQWKWKFSIFEKQLFLIITFPFIDDFTLNIDEINDFWSFGLWWPFWSSLALDEFFKQRPVFDDKY